MLVPWRAEGPRFCSLGHRPRAWWRSQMRAEGPRYTRCHAAIALVCVGAFDLQYEGATTVVDGCDPGRDACGSGGVDRNREHLRAGWWSQRSRPRGVVYRANGNDGEVGGEAEGFVGEVDQDQGAGVRKVRMAARVRGVFRWVERSGGVGAVYRWAGHASSATGLSGGDAGDVREV